MRRQEADNEVPPMCGGVLKFQFPDRTSCTNVAVDPTSIKVWGTYAIQSLSFL